MNINKFKFIQNIMHLRFFYSIIQARKQITPLNKVPASLKYSRHVLFNILHTYILKLDYVLIYPYI